MAIEGAITDSKAPNVNTPAEQKMVDFVKARYDMLVKGRYVEEKEWYESGLFEQLRQWLDEDPTTGRLRPKKPNPAKPYPMPVSNHFSATIALNSNALGADIPQMRALSDNYDSANREAAEAAENAIDAANRESGMEILNPILAKHTVLFGIGCAKDTIDTTSGSETVSTLEEQQTGVDEQGQPIIQEVPGEANQIPTTKLQTRILLPFEWYVERDAGVANNSEAVYERYRRHVQELRASFPNKADQIQPDNNKDGSLSLFYVQSLRRLTFGGSIPLDEDENQATVWETWIQWNRLDDDTQKAIEAEWAGQPCEAYPDKDMLEAAVAYGLFIVITGDTCLEMQPNPDEGDFPYTFFPFQVDVANPYPKGLAVELKPLQKQLNRIDSLTERSLMANASGKWLKPISQTRTDFTGDPNDVIEYDALGDGKVKPEFVQPSPYSNALVARRQQIIQEFQQLGYTAAIDRGDAVGAGSTTGPFRALAFLGSKAEESRKTQRFLFEQAHEIRARKLVKKAKKAWDTPRKVKVAGYNNTYGAMQLEAADLGDPESYEIEVIQDSSRPKTIDEKLEVVSTLVQAGLLDVTDPDVREYITTILGVTDFNLIDHLQYKKADRDLFKLKQGIQPFESPFEKWDIELKSLAKYTLTEEFENLQPNIKLGILTYGQYISDKLSLANTPPVTPGQVAQQAGSLAPQPGHVLHGVPGQQFGPGKVQGAAQQEADQVINNLPQESNPIG